MKVGIIVGMAWHITGVSSILVQVCKGPNLSDSSFGWVRIGECSTGCYWRLVSGQITPLLWAVRAEKRQGLEVRKTSVGYLVRQLQGDAGHVSAVRCAG